ncbi:hypothetical protein EC919_11095 [Pseudomonas graminis]|nr:hypothetical protein EC919_11095 [Pseudomonas graminis]
MPANASCQSPLRQLTGRVASKPAPTDLHLPRAQILRCRRTLFSLTHRIRRFTAASRQIAGKRAPTPCGQRQTAIQPNSPAISHCGVVIQRGLPRRTQINGRRKPTVGARLPANAVGQSPLHQLTGRVRQQAGSHGFAFAASANLALSPHVVLADTPHSPLYCRCAPDRGQARSYALRAEADRDTCHFALSAEADRDTCHFALRAEADRDPCHFTCDFTLRGGHPTRITNTNAD